jgi:hypothetical protein
VIDATVVVHDAPREVPLVLVIGDTDHRRGDPSHWHAVVDIADTHAVDVASATPRIDNANGIVITVSGRRSTTIDIDALIGVCSSRDASQFPLPTSLFLLLLRHVHELSATLGGFLDLRHRHQVRRRRLHELNRIAQPPDQLPNLDTKFPNRLRFEFPGGPRLPLEARVDVGRRDTLRTSKNTRLGTSARRACDNRSRGTPP